MCSTLVIGALMTKDKDLHSELYKIQKYKGATPSPFDCFLVLRSLATFELRMERHMKSGKIVAEFLSTHPKAVMETEFFKFDLQNKKRDLVKVKLYTIRSETEKREREIA